MTKQAWIIALGALMLATEAFAAEELKGWLEWVHEVEMRVLENGVVDEVLVSAGQHVVKGDRLLRMDQREAQARLLEAKARVARARVEVEKAGRDLVRSQELFDRGLIAIEELKDAELSSSPPRRRRKRRRRPRPRPKSHSNTPSCVPPSTGSWSRARSGTGR